MLPGFTRSTVGSMMAGRHRRRRHSGVLHELMQAIAELLPKRDGRVRILAVSGNDTAAGLQAGTRTQQ